jgi:uncharacterized membrane protein YkoI
MNADKRHGTLLLTVLLCTSVQARDLDQDEALLLRQQGTILALEQLVDKALGRHPGAKLLEAELEEKHDIYVYEFELLTTEGIVRELKFDARDGRLLKDEED